MPKLPKPVDQLDQAPGIANYENKPVQNYGLSLLKGMGFTEERGIGFNKQNALSQPLVLKPRPKGLGLGAKLQVSVQEKSVFNKQEFILITSEPHKGMIGVIKKVKKQQEIMTVELALSGTQLKLKFNEVLRISQTEYKDLKEKLVKQQKQRIEQNNDKKKKRLKWVLPNIRCKVIDKLSLYYLKKIVVNQLLSQRQIECIYVSQGGETKYIRQLTEKQLQTVLPKIDGIVLILDKKNKAQKATLLQRNKQKGQVIVQMLETLQIESLSEENVSQYVEF